MKTTSILMSTAIGTLLAFSAVTAQGGAHEGAGAATEKCYGIAAAGENGCAANGHSCQGQAKTSNDLNEWKKVAQGECAKLGGSTTAGKKAS